MTPGIEVMILNPRLKGFIGDTNTALVSSAQPLILIKPYTALNNLLPKPITENEDYSFFNFITKSLQIGSATYVNNVCYGVLCDGSGNKNNQCGCIAAAK